MDVIWISRHTEISAKFFFPITLFPLAWIGSRVQRRPEEALRAVEKAMRLNPHYPPFYLFYLGWTYDLTGRYAEAVATLKEVINRSPDYLAAHLNLTGSYVQ
jgi:tetratricopeptide (TPR) repeat protein